MSQNRPEHSSWAQEIRKPGERAVWFWWCLQRMEEKGNGFLFPISPLDILSPFSLHHLGGGGGRDRSGNPGQGPSCCFPIGPAWLRRQAEEPCYFISSALEGIWLFDSNNTRVADAPSDNQVTKLDLNGSVESSTVPLAGVGDSKSVRNISPQHRHFCARAEDFLSEKRWGTNEPQWVLQGEEIEIDLLRK